MKKKITATYDVPPEALARMFANPDFHVRKLEEAGITRYEILNHEVNGDDVSIKVSRHVPLDAPRAVRKVIPAEVNSISNERWNAKTLRGNVSTETGIPVEISCSALISAQGSGCVVHYDWEIKAKVPLIGGALEKFIAGDMEKRMAHEAEAASRVVKEFV